MNLRLRLNIIITLILLCMLSIGSYTAVQNARENVQAEVASTALLALNMFDIQNLNFALNNGWMTSGNKGYKSVFDLQKLHNVRHIKVEFFDIKGVLHDSNRNPDQLQDQVSAWFYDIMDTVSEEMNPTVRQVFFQGRVIGDLVITPDPYYEIMEIWSETKTILWVLCLFFVVVNIIIYFAVGRALRPIKTITKGLTSIEAGVLSTRLPSFNLPELAPISDKFNVMAEALEASISKNHQLTHKIILLQETERKNLARELHDEIGQHLTAINVDATAVMQANNWQQAKASAEAISSVVLIMMDIVHNILKRLRPGDLQELGLADSLAELLRGWQIRNSMIDYDLSCDKQFSKLSYPVSVTIYRIVQECLTNISKHAKASHVRIKCHQRDDVIKLSIIDDGVGFDVTGKTEGFGLTGIRERIEGLDGQFELTSSTDAGVQLEISLPLKYGENV
jgi:two-component system sensor histidine kinase UhpB